MAVAGAGGGGGEVAQITAFHLEAADAEIGLEVGDLELRAGGAGTARCRRVAIEGEDAAKAGAVLHERLELRELHLVAGDVGAERSAAEVVQRVLIIRRWRRCGTGRRPARATARRWLAGS